MAFLVLPALLCNGAPARAPYPGTYTLESGWPADLAKIGRMNGSKDQQISEINLSGLLLFLLTSTYSLRLLILLIVWGLA